MASAARTPTIFRFKRQGCGECTKMDIAFHRQCIRRWRFQDILHFENPSPHLTPHQNIKTWIAALQACKKKTVKRNPRWWSATICVTYCQVNNFNREEKPAISLTRGAKNKTKAKSTTVQAHFNIQDRIPAWTCHWTTAKSSSSGIVKRSTTSMFIMISWRYNETAQQYWPRLMCKGLRPLQQHFNHLAYWV